MRAKNRHISKRAPKIIKEFIDETMKLHEGDSHWGVHSRSWLWQELINANITDLRYIIESRHEEAVGLTWSKYEYPYTVPSGTRIPRSTYLREEGTKHYIKFLKKILGDLLATACEIDPVCKRTKGKKSPYAKSVFWWVINQNIKLPEDIGITIELLQEVQRLKGLDPAIGRMFRPKDIIGLQNLRHLVEEHELVKKTEIPHKAFDEKLKKVASSGPYKVYLLDTWPKAEWALKGTGWCTKEKPNFDNYFSTGGPLFLFLKRGKRVYNMSIRNPSYITELVNRENAMIQDEVQLDRDMHKLLDVIADKYIGEDFIGTRAYHEFTKRLGPRRSRAYEKIMFGKLRWLVENTPENYATSATCKEITDYAAIIRRRMPKKIEKLMRRCHSIWPLYERDIIKRMLDQHDPSKRGYPRLKT